ncbi:hypothetical protein H6F43_16755 [Leptolyngbya sp. FACHB-36]|uniref:hypothetical protein n=1 Tax=Leptolyngbya sp. FACHB-36 TaxID=2692808 RepID=UPI00168006D2|nr:hypothetical protein [Leptolyngbya sp. FACHB-36]MBD2021833.1 hypothetical protein [Leptolyngbya sp. FACHB-36]
MPGIAELFMRNAQPPVSSAKPAPGTSYSPSVPISLYRQVATELQSTQAALESLKQQNQQLTEQNQRLRSEIERVVQSTLQLHQLADAQPVAVALPEAAPQPALVPIEPLPPPKPKTPPRKRVPKLEPAEPTAPAPRFTEQEVQPRRTPQPERATEIGGLWLVLVIFLIVITAFGTGFLIVRPLLPNR